MRFLLAVTIAITVALPANPGGDAAIAGRLKRFTKTDTVEQSGETFVQAHNARITELDNPFVFARAGKFRRLERISITVTLDDAETMPGDPNANQLSLALDGIDTGILLNGFGNDETRRTIGGVPDNAGQILAALKADGELNATIIDAVPGDNVLSVPDFFDTRLELKGKQKVKKR